MYPVTFYMLAIYFLKEFTFPKKVVSSSLNSSKTFSLYLINFSLILFSHVTVFGQEYMFYSCCFCSMDRHNLFSTVLDLIEQVCTNALNILSNSSLEISYSRETCSKLETSLFLLFLLFLFNGCMVVIIIIITSV